MENQKEKVRRTKKLSNEEYDGIPVNMHDLVKNHVNKEEKKWYNETPVPIPEIEKVEVKKFMPGWVNFVKNIIFELKP